MIHHQRLSFLIHDLTCVLRIILPVTKPFFEVLTLDWLC
nr:MAG TPA: hypothetical protein [Caudoviricetes sp.]